MKLQDFDYPLPQHLIAQSALKKRDHARLMVIDRKANTIKHDIFSNIANYIPKESIFVINNSKVIPARLLGKKERSGGQVEIFVLNKTEDDYTYHVLLRPVRRTRYGDKIVFGQNGFFAEIKDKNTVRFSKKGVLKYLDRLGHIPLPPYIKRPDKKEDRKYYQTVYARHAGSVAAPTAGLHFTKQLLNSLKKHGYVFEHVTLHINYATFKPVEEKDIRKHHMHSESYRTSKATALRLQRKKAQGKAIVAVGTTSCRVLETVAATAKLEGDTDLFIYPGYSFQMVDCLLTNFHLPKSTLLMLVSAFGGQDLIRRAYREAVKKKYRFYSYGDAMLII